MTYKLHFYNSKYNELIVEYELTELDSIPESLATLTKSKDNDLLIVNTIKASILPYLPRDINDYKRERILALLKEVHELSFSIVNSDNQITYQGKPIEKEKTESSTDEIDYVEVPSHRLSVQDLNLVELLKSKQYLDEELQKVNTELDKQLITAWEIINTKLAELNTIKSKWETLNANQLDSDAITSIYSAQTNLLAVNLPLVD